MDRKKRQQELGQDLTHLLTDYQVRVMESLLLGEPLTLGLANTALKRKGYIEMAWRDKETEKVIPSCIAPYKFPARFAPFERVTEAGKKALEEWKVSHN